MKKWQKIVILLLVTLLLNGCSSINSKFDCPMKSGIRCESISSVNARIDRGEIGGSVSQAGISSPFIQPMGYKAPHYVNSSERPFKKGEPLRQGETVMRVWLAPFEDKEGNYHQESVIYTITRSGAWIGVPLKELDSNGE